VDIVETVFQLGHFSLVENHQHQFVLQRRQGLPLEGKPGIEQANLLVHHGGRILNRGKALRVHLGKDGAKFAIDALARRRKSRLYLFCLG